MRFDFREEGCQLRPCRVLAAGVLQDGGFCMIDLETGEAERYVRKGGVFQIDPDRPGRPLSERVTLALPVRLEEYGTGRVWQTGSETPLPRAPRAAESRAVKAGGGHTTFPNGDILPGDSAVEAICILFGIKGRPQSITVTDGADGGVSLRYDVRASAGPADGADWWKNGETG
jgi:hypothetical protein